MGFGGGNALRLRRKHDRARRGSDQRGGAISLWVSRRPRSDRTHRRSDQRGGAISLWVVLMVPVSAFAAVAAMAGPQRVAAESSVQDAADDLAMLAVAWRDGQGSDAGVGEPAGELHAFPPECDNEDQPTHLDDDIEQAMEIVQQAEQAEEEAEQAVGTARQHLEALRIQDAPAQEVLDAEQVLTDAEQALDDAEQALDEARLRLSNPGTGYGLQERRVEVLAEWGEACDLVFKSLLRDLGNLGLDTFSLRGFYSDSLSVSQLETLTPPPCRPSGGTVAADAVHVAVAADWQLAGWAAAQVWPQGVHMAAESIGRLNKHDTDSTDVLPCDAGALTILDERGRPKRDPDDPSRQLTRSVPRTPMSN